MQDQPSSTPARDSNGNGQTAKVPRSAERAEAAAADANRRAERMLRGLCREVLQSETVVRLHCAHEAERLGQVPPAAALRAIATHAGQALKSLPGQGTPEQLPMSVAATFTGTVLTTLRETIVDRVISSERAYRSTLLGLREGVDLVRMLQELARVQFEPVLEAWCRQWLEARTPLVRDAEAGLAWFPQNSDRATQIARPFKPPRRV